MRAQGAIDRLAAVLLVFLAAEPSPAVYVAMIVLGVGFVADVLAKRQRDQAASLAVRLATALPHDEASQDKMLRTAVRRAGLRECDTLDGG